MSKRHEYALAIEWTGNTGQGTKSYKSYTRDYSIAAAGKPVIRGSSDPAFLGDRTRYNPEDLLVASLSACHMLWYLHLCSANAIVVLDYKDAVKGVMEEGPDGSGAFTEVNLQPEVTIAAPGNVAKATALHEEAHEKCFIARSVNFEVRVSPNVVERQA